MFRPFLVLALEYLLSLILSQVPLFMRSTLLSETQKNMMKQTLSLELVRPLRFILPFIFVVVAFTRITSFPISISPRERRVPAAEAIRIPNERR